LLGYIITNLLSYRKLIKSDRSADFCIKRKEDFIYFSSIKKNALQGFKPLESIVLNENLRADNGPVKLPYRPVGAGMHGVFGG
jgi:hypothetical protein